MDFKSILSVAKENKVYADQEIPVKRYSTEISAPKKPPKSAVKSAAVREFLAKKQAEEDKKAVEAEERRRELLDLRSEAKHNRKATTMAKRTKDNNFMINWQFSAQLAKDENGEIHSLNPYASKPDEAAGSSKGPRNGRRDEPSSSKTPAPSKPKLLPAPPVDFYDLLQLASKKQHQPIVLPRIPKKTQPTGDVQLQGRPMTNAEKRQFMEEQARREGRSLASVSLPQKRRARFRLKEGDDPNAEFVQNFTLDAQSLGKGVAPPPPPPRQVGPVRKDGSLPPKSANSSRPSTCPRGQNSGDRASSRSATGQESQRDSRRPTSNGSGPSRTDGCRPIPKLRDDSRGGGPASKSRPAPPSASAQRRDSNLLPKCAPSGGGVPQKSAPRDAQSSNRAAQSSSAAPNKSRSLPTSNGGFSRPSERPSVAGGRPQNGTTLSKQSSLSNSRPPASRPPSSSTKPPPPQSASRSVGRGGASCRPAQNGSRSQDPSSRPTSAAHGRAPPQAPAGKSSTVSGKPPTASSAGDRLGKSSVPVKPPSSAIGASKNPVPGKSSTGRPQMSTSSSSSMPSKTGATARPTSNGKTAAPAKQVPPPQGVQRRPGGGAAAQPPPPKQFPPRDMMPKQFPPRDLLPKQFPPRDMMPSQRMNPRGGIRPVKRRIESDDEYDEEMDDFIDDGPVGDNIDYSQHIKEIFGYDRNRYAHESYEDLDRMESSFAQQMKEEAISTKLGIMEDLEDIQREQDEIKRRKITCKKVKRK